MEPVNPNYDRNQILAWLHECNKHLSGARAYHARLNDDARFGRFDDRSCSQALPGQTVICGYPSQSASDRQSAASPISSYDASAVAHSKQQLSQEAALRLQPSTWKTFYDICKELHPFMTKKFKEEQIYNGLLRAIMKNIVSLETIITMQDACRLSDTQRQSFHHAFVGCIIESTPTTSGAKRVVNRRCEVTASTAEISENVLSAKLASSDDWFRPLPADYSPTSPKTQRAIPLRKSVRLSSSDSGSWPELRQELEDDVVLATKLSLRDIGDSTFSTLVVGASIDGPKDSAFNHETTLFAGSKNSDLNGDIHDTIDDIPPGKKFEKIHFINMPESTFDDPKKNRVLFNKISNLLVDYGKLSISFDVNGQGYSNQTFADKILKPSGFGQFCFLVKSSATCPSVNMIASKTGAPQYLVPESEEVVSQSVLSSACTGVTSVQHQRPDTASNQVWKEYSLAKKQLINMMQGGKQPLNHDIIQRALSSPANPDYDLSIEEFASLKVRYDAWHDHKPASGLPLNHEIHNFNDRLREARELYKALVDHQEEGYLADARPGATPVLQPVSSSNDLAGQNLHLAAQNTASKQQIDNIIEALKKEFKGLKSAIVSRHIPFLALSKNDIDQAVAGCKSALDKILVESQIRESCYPTSGDTGLSS